MAGKNVVDRLSLTDEWTDQVVERREFIRCLVDPRTGSASSIWYVGYLSLGRAIPELGQPAVGLGLTAIADVGCLVYLRAAPLLVSPAQLIAVVSQAGTAQFWTVRFAAQLPDLTRRIELTGIAFPVKWDRGLFPESSFADLLGDRPRVFAQGLCDRPEGQSCIQAGLNLGSLFRTKMLVFPCVWNTPLFFHLGYLLCIARDR